MSKPKSSLTVAVIGLIGSELMSVSPETRRPFSMRSAWPDPRELIH